MAEALDRLLRQLDQASTTGASQKKMLEEAEKRLSLLYTQMANPSIRQDVCDRLYDVVKGK